MFRSMRHRKKERALPGSWCNCMQGKSLGTNDGLMVQLALHEEI